jgi:biopolymer transport protein ExbD
VLKPNINVTPLIDVLLVLLIIFMVVSPLKPSSFRARLPAEPQPDSPAKEHPKTLAVIVGRDSTISLNYEVALGTVAEPLPLIQRLRTVFAERIANAADSLMAADPERPFPDRVERTVFIKAPRDLPYGSIIKVVDAVKLAGAYPIALQIDLLE